MATNISIPTYGFVNHILALNEGNWRTFFKPFITDSIQSGLATLAGANMTVYVSAGECRCGAVMGILDEMIALDVANGDSTYNRIDSVIVQYTYGEPSTLAVAIVQGTPSANPVPPTLTKVYDTLWQMEIAQILVPSGATSSSEFTITDKRVIYESIESIIDDNTESEERVWSSQKTREEIVSLSTEIYNSLNTKADVIERNVSGDIVTITDGGDNLPVKELVVGIDPVQDLHGYDIPWPAGGGKNLLPPGNSDSSTAGDVTFTNNGDGTFNVSGTSDGIVNWFITKTEQPIPTYMNGAILSGGVTEKISVSITYYDENGTWKGAQFAWLSDTTLSVPSDVTKYRLGLRFGEANVSYTGVMKPMIRVSGNSTWEPYSNVCPISGHSSATVTRTGINIWDEEWEVGIIDAATGANSENSNCIRSKNYISVVPSQNYYLVGYNGTSGVYEVFFYGADKSYLGYREAQNLTGNIIAVPSNCHYIRFRNYAAYGTTYGNDISINYPATDTAYHAGHVQTVTISLGSTVYGAQLDAVAGTLTVDRAYMSPTSLKTGAYSIASTYYYPWIDISSPGEFLQGLCNKLICTTDAGVLNQKPSFVIRSSFITFSPEGHAYSNESDARTAGESFIQNGDVQFVYPITPTIITGLTPAQISLLLGENNVWSDTGNILNLTYRTDTKKYIEQKVADTNRKTCEIMTIVTDKMIAPDNLTVGDLVIVNNDLYKVINSNIASGEAMVVGTNVMKITLAEYIQSLI